jgi:hypothetical protein
LLALLILSLRVRTLPDRFGTKALLAIGFHAAGSAPFFLHLQLTRTSSCSADGLYTFAISPMCW